MLSFGSASMLWWGLAAVIPFVLHLWNRKPKQVVPFAATRFLVAATKRQSRRIRFQQWILLLARVMILLLFALALAEPRWGGSATAIQSGVATHHLLVIDDSYSMATKIDSEARLDLAKGRLKDLVRSAPSGDLFSLVTIGDPAQILIAGPSHDRAEVEKAIDDVEVRQVEAKVVPAVSAVRRLIDDGQSLSTNPRAHRVKIASDLARNSFGEVDPQQMDADLASTAAGTTWSLLAIGDTPPQNNLAIAEFGADQSAVYFGQQLTGQVTISNTGAQRVEGAILEIRAGQQILFREAVSLASGQQQSVPWKIRAERESLLLEARIDPDDLETDNRRFLSIDVRQAPRILCLASSEEASRHVVMGLTSGPLETRPKVDLIQTTSADGALPVKLAAYDAIVLLNIPPPSGELARELKTYIENGGGVLIGLGDRVLAKEVSAASEIYPATLGAVMKQDSPRIDPLNYAHPLVAVFRDAPEVGLLTLPVWRYYKLDKIQPSARIAARFSNGDAALVEQSLGRGRVVLFAGSLGAESIDSSEAPPTPWSGLTGSAAYVPLLQEWVMRCATPESAPALLVGAPATNLVSGNPYEYSTGETWKAVTTAPRTLDRAGFYREIAEAKKGPTIAVNIDTRESWFQSDRERFASWIDARAPQTSTISIGGQRTYQALSAWLLIPLALLVCGEILLATLMRRRKSPLALRERQAT